MSLDREKAQTVLNDVVRRVANNDYSYEREQVFLDALKACVMPDPRMGRIEVLCNEYDEAGIGYVADELRAILRGES